VPDDDPGGDVSNPRSLLRHNGPFLARMRVVPLFFYPTTPHAAGSPSGHGL
jgi:hypothetical protein